MTIKRSGSGSFKIVATLGMVLLMAFLSACEILATEGARNAIANGREIREFEDRELAPLEKEMSDLWEYEINPRQTELEDLHYQLQTLEEDLLRPLWDAQNDVWAPGGEASEAQLVFDARYRELELAHRTIEVEQRDLDAAWQTLWNGSSADPGYQALEDLRYEKQRELDRLYRFGYRPIDDIWDEINELNATHGSVNIDSQIEVDRINAELQRLWDLISVMQYDGSGEEDRLYDRANVVQEQLNNLYDFGWDPIYEIYAEIERLEGERASSTSDVDSIAAQIAELETLKASYIASRDAEVASLKDALAAVETDATTESPSDSSDRIAELEQLIDDLNVERAALLAPYDAEIDALNVQIHEIKALYDQLEADVKANFEALSNSLSAEADALDNQIHDLAEVGGDDAAAQIAILQPQLDAVEAAEAAAKSAYDADDDQLKADEDAELAEPKALKDAAEAVIAGGLTDAVDAQLAEYHAELSTLLTSANGTPVTVSNTRSSADILAEIEAVETYWNSLIDEVTNQILTLENERLVGSTSDGLDSRIHSLKLQAAVEEESLNAEIANLEAVINELYRQANNADYGSSGQLAEIQAQSDALNAELEAIWKNESTGGLDVRQRVQELEKQARILEEEYEQNTRSLEEELWVLDDKLSLFYKDRESDNRATQAEFEAKSAAIQQRRFELEEQRWAIDEEQRAVFDEIDAKQRAAAEAISVIEDEQLSVLRNQTRVLEVELRSLYGQQRVLESAMREAQALVEEKKRELEDRVFDALEEAVGIAGETAVAVETAEAGETGEAGEAGETAEAASSTSDGEVPVTGGGVDSLTDATN